MTSTLPVTHPWAAAPRALLVTLAVVTAMLVAAVVTLSLVLSADGTPADSAVPVPPPPAKTCPGGPPNADC